ncbi:CCA tRNA nucleotidyltransferase [Anaplasma phagocytophilum]|nr:CCA tRNA nucleotidyltransferase [Anaplasma phagocytophilum]KDB56746.1 poly(A) polymerase [Anaplasma phagocytophilum str. CRT35]KJV82070.1 poly A polymerase head domain protein [Anaplasma phagocytophilum str. CRT53-1]
MLNKLIDNAGVQRIIKVLESFNGSVRLVGGCVRDSIIQRETTDIDLATDLLPKTVLTSLKAAGIKAIPTGMQHGTVTAVVAGVPYEITTLRLDTKCDGRHASVVFTDNWEADASRRDFTFNALYCDKNGKIYDYFTGIRDLQSRTVAFIGDAEQRINEDFLRILRVFRFHASICSDSALSEEIINVCSKHASKLALLSKERIRSEFFKLLACRNCVGTLRIMERCNILAQIIPYHINVGVLSSPQIATRSPIAKLAALLHTENPAYSVVEIAQNLTAALRLSRKEKNLLETLLLTKLELPLTAAQQQKYMNALGTEIYKDLVIINSLKSASLPESILHAHLASSEDFTPVTLPISGKDLIQLGYPTGRVLGQTLRLLQAMWEEDIRNVSREQLLVTAKRLLEKISTSTP